ncbi:unnamed protein product [Lota lota]
MSSAALSRTSLETAGRSEGPVAWERMLGVWKSGPSEAAARAIVPQEKRLVLWRSQAIRHHPVKVSQFWEPGVGPGPRVLLTTSAPGRSV